MVTQAYLSHIVESAVSPVDQHGRHISPAVLVAAQAIRQRALRFAEKELGDPAVAASILEECAADVSRALYGGDGKSRDLVVGNLPGYLFRSVVRKVDRLKQKELPVALYSERTLQFQSFDPSRKLELNLLMQELLTKCDDFTKRSFESRVHGYSWKEIGKVNGISAHSAESRFSQGLRRLRGALEETSERLRSTSRVPRDSKPLCCPPEESGSHRSLGSNRNPGKFRASKTEPFDQMAAVS